MSITRVVDLQRKMRQLGRIRTGTKNERGQPQKLGWFRLTSNDRAALEHAAEKFGGEVKEWVGGTERFELLTRTAELPIVVAPIPATTQYERWGQLGNGEFGLIRRCDGCVISAGRDQGQGCQCEEDPKTRAALAKQQNSDQCQLVARIWVRLPDLPDVGAWRVDTKSYYAASEMPTTLDGLMELAAGGYPLEAVLALEIRGKGKTKYPVPVVRVRQTMRELAAMAEEYRERQAALTGGAGNRPLSAVLTAPVRELPAGGGDRG